MGVLRTFRRLGFKVPEDVTVTGYDHLMAAEMLDVGFTIVRQPLELLGREAVRFVLSAIEPPDGSRRQLRLLAELVVRGSTSRLN